MASAPEVKWMCTGPRPDPSRLNPEATERAMISLLSASEDVVAVCGGADGVDRLWARAAFKLGIPFDLWVPNGYEKHYQLGEWFDHMFHHARRVMLTQVQMGQPHLKFSPKLNFVRNIQMVEEADQHLICSPLHPEELIKEARGGTRHCANEILKRKLPYVWINSLTGETLRCPQKSPQMASTDTLW